MMHRAQLLLVKGRPCWMCICYQSLACSKAGHVMACSSSTEVSENGHSLGLAISSLLSGTYLAYPPPCQQAVPKYKHLCPAYVPSA